MTGSNNMADWRSNLDCIPEHMRSGLALYIEQGVEPGSFLTAVLCNELVGAYGAADMVNSHCMRAWAEFMYCHMPGATWGNEEIVQGWMAMGGLQGNVRAETPEPVIEAEDASADMHE